MKTSRIAQFAITGAVISLGCALLLADAATALVILCFCFAPFALYRRSDLARPVSARELWMTAEGLAVFVALIVLAHHVLPQSFDETLLRHPLSVGVIWVAAMAALFWRFKRECRLIDA